MVFRVGTEGFGKRTTVRRVRLCRRGGSGNGLATFLFLCCNIPNRRCCRTLSRNTASCCRATLSSGTFRTRRFRTTRLSGTGTTTTRRKSDGFGSRRLWCSYGSSRSRRNNGRGRPSGGSRTRTAKNTCSFCGTARTVYLPSGLPVARTTCGKGFGRALWGYRITRWGRRGFSGGTGAGFRRNGLRFRRTFSGNTRRRTRAFTSCFGTGGANGTTGFALRGRSA